MIIELIVLIILIYLYTKTNINKELLIHFTILYVCCVLILNKHKENFVIEPPETPKLIFDIGNPNYLSTTNNNTDLYFNFNVGCSVFKERIEDTRNHETKLMEQNELNTILNDYIYVKEFPVTDKNQIPQIYNIKIPNNCQKSNLKIESQIEAETKNEFEYQSLKAIHVLTGFKAILYTKRNINNEIVLTNNEKITKNSTIDYDNNNEELYHISTADPHRYITEPRKDDETTQYAKPSHIGIDTYSKTSTNYLYNTYGSRNVPFDLWQSTTNFPSYSTCHERINDWPQFTNPPECQKKQVYFDVEYNKFNKDYNREVIINGPMLINLSNHKLAHLTDYPITDDRRRFNIDNNFSNKSKHFEKKLLSMISNDEIDSHYLRDKILTGKTSNGHNFKNEVTPFTYHYKLVHHTHIAHLGILPIKPWWYDFNESTTKIIVEYKNDELTKYNYSIRTSGYFDNDHKNQPNLIPFLSNINNQNLSSFNMFTYPSEIHSWLYLRTTDLSCNIWWNISIKIKLLKDSDIDSDIDSDNNYYFKSVWGNIEIEDIPDGNNDINHNHDQTKEMCNFTKPTILENNIDFFPKANEAGIPSELKTNNTPITNEITININNKNMATPNSPNNDLIHNYKNGYNYFAIQSLNNAKFEITSITLDENPGIYVLIYKSIVNNESSEISKSVKLYNYNKFQIPIDSDKNLIINNYNILDNEKPLIIPDEKQHNIDCTIIPENQEYFINSNLCTININTALGNQNENKSILNNKIELNPALHVQGSFIIGFTIKNIEYGLQNDPINFISIKSIKNDDIIEEPLISIDNSSMKKTINILKIPTNINLLSLHNHNHNIHQISPTVTFLFSHIKSNPPVTELRYKVNDTISTYTMKHNNYKLKLLDEFIITHIAEIPQNGIIENFILNTNPSNDLINKLNNNINDVFNKI